MEYEPIASEKYYHIFNRGNNREDIFMEEQIYSYFLELLKKHILTGAQILT
ncbi:hypothetical protein [Aequorivita ciconiae]|uniref:hypothetical protein n=1 Tax=Aequorivita ciconiae TaxID=2494375 RepID=UPI001F0C6195|nr:hypothetical protein [Aequorivita sp. H23M31]